MSQIENLPGMKWVMDHPRIAAWIVLSVGMVVLLALEARDVGLLATQWLALIVATVLILLGVLLLTAAYYDRKLSRHYENPVIELFFRL